MSPRPLASAALALVFVLLAAAPAAQARVPFGWVGTNADGTLFTAPSVDLEGEVGVMAGAGLESMRVLIDWRVAQPYASAADVPPERRSRFRDEDGVPTDWARPDRIVAAAAERGMTVLPVVQIAPRWAARYPGEFSSPPKSPAPYGRFVAALARRYGPAGTFWTERPDLRPQPIRAWQIWNEPSLRDFWKDRRWARPYVALMRSARIHLRAVDPGAKVVMAGLPNESWSDLARVYRVRGARRYFDRVALHPFTGRVAGVVEIIRRGRAVMRRHGDARKPLVVTELSWPSALGKTRYTYGFDVSERGQARKARAALLTLARQRRKLRISAVYWYTWLTEDRRDDYPFDYAGASRLGRDGEVVRKPAFRAIRSTALRLRGCRSKPAGARSCAR